MRRGVDYTDDAAQEHLRFLLHDGDTLQQLPHLLTGTARNGKPFLRLVHHQGEKRPQQSPEYGCPQRIDIADALDGPTGIVGPEDVESSGKYEPEPADGLSEAVLGRGIGDPDQKRIGEQRITEPAQGIGREHQRVMQSGQRRTDEAAGTQQVEHEPGEHRPFDAVRLGQDAREPRRNSDGHAVHGEKPGGLLQGQTPADEVRAQPSLLDAVAHHENKNSQIRPGKGFGQADFVENCPVHSKYGFMLVWGFVDIPASSPLRPTLSGKFRIKIAAMLRVDKGTTNEILIFFLQPNKYIYFS